MYLGATKRTKLPYLQVSGQRETKQVRIGVLVELGISHPGVRQGGLSTVAVSFKRH